MRDQEKQRKYELLEALLQERGMTLKGAYTSKDVANIFGVSVRTIQEWSKSDSLRPRTLPGRLRFLSSDLETFLRKSSESETNLSSRDSSSLLSIAPKSRVLRRVSS